MQKRGEFENPGENTKKGECFSFPLFILFFISGDVVVTEFSAFGKSVFSVEYAVL